MQRLLDIIFSSIALLALSFLFIPIVIILFLTGEREVFYTQLRVGKNATEFKLLKFATMLKNSPSLGTGSVTIKNDSRILPFGKFLRKTKINELPQLLNVLKGDMSLIGPRPMTALNFSYYDKNSAAILSSVRPGLSGVGSIFFRDEEEYLNGKRDPVKFYKEIITTYKAELEIWYVKNKNLKLYFLLIFLTIYIIFLNKKNCIFYIFKNLPNPPIELA
jgi:lipopolysaccharide/colanic/teichoic acid biosynthesis glycosyltransferase